MPKKYKLHFRNDSSGEEYEIEGELSEEDCSLLERYLTNCDRLFDSKWIKEGMPCSLHLEFKIGQPLSGSADLPDWDDIIVVLHKFRRFGLQNESTYFYKIANLLSRNIQLPFFHSIIDRFRKQFSGAQFQQQMAITSNDVILNSERILNDWLNAYEYHEDEDKKAFIDSLHRILPLELTKPILLHVLSDRIRAVFKMASFVEVILGRNDNLKGKF
jgi:hypothetical protein